LIETDSKRKGRANLSLVVSDSVAAIAPLPWQDGLSSEAELRGYAQICFEKLGYDISGNWVLRVEYPRYGAGGLAYALPRDWMLALLAILENRQLRLTGVLPISALLFTGVPETARPGLTIVLIFEATQHGVLVFENGALASRDVEPFAQSIEKTCHRLLARAGWSKGRRKTSPESALVGIQRNRISQASDRRARHRRRGDPNWQRSARMTRKPLEAFLAPKSRHALAIGLLILVLALAAAWLALLGAEQFNRSKRLDAQLTQLQGAQAARAVPTASRQQVDEAKQWAQVRQEKDFPWDMVFRSIERTSSPEVELLEFHPDKLNHIIVLRGEARSVDGLLAYLQALTVRTGWVDVHLTHQEKVQHGALETIEVKANLGT
jgi:hypothetical protein